MTLSPSTILYLGVRVAYFNEDSTDNMYTLPPVRKSLLQGTEYRTLSGSRHNTFYTNKRLSATLTG